jgi:hypothetical protein
MIIHNMWIYSHRVSKTRTHLNLVDVGSSTVNMATVNSAVGTVDVSRSIKRRVESTLLPHDRITIVVSDRHADRRGVDVTVAPDEEGAEDGLGDEVEDTVEDGFRVGRDDVATLAETPGDGVQDPEEGCQGATVGEALADFGAVAGGVAASFPDELVEDVEEGNAAWSGLVVVCGIYCM